MKRPLRYAALAALGLLGALAALRARGPAAPPTEGPTEAAAGAARGTAATSGSAPPRFAADPAAAVRGAPPSFVPTPTQAPLAPAETSALMDGWRQAIVARDAEKVETIFALFRSRAAEFRAPIFTCAERDGDARVRAFCTRSVGYLKLDGDETGDLLERLLRDPSEHVRANAAWALGVLGDRRARRALAALAKRDPSAAVRRNAAATIAAWD